MPGDLGPPGAEIMVKAEYGDEETTFTGIVVRHGVKIGSNNELRQLCRISAQSRSLAIRVQRGKRLVRRTSPQDSGL